MPDMLVKLYELADPAPLIQELAAGGIHIRRAMAYEKDQVVTWVRRNFGSGWASECDVAFSNHPVSCYLGTREGEILGFGCYDSTCKNFFGPAGVAETARGIGIGKAVLIACLHAMFMQGFAYAIIGGVGPADFYARAAGAVEIPGSTPGIYRDLLKMQPDK
jgi:hypothetical protein